MICRLIARVDAAVQRHHGEGIALLPRHVVDDRVHAPALDASVHRPVGRPRLLAGALNLKAQSGT